MFETFSIQSHSGPYSVELRPFQGIFPGPGQHFFIDKNVARLYEKDLSAVLSSGSVLIIEATEQAKTLDRFTDYIEHLVANRARRNHTLVAIGGGIIQDIVCFISATFLRGVEWQFVPTTLLAQADSCIGSKSSINVGSAKNLLGTFTPPRRIVIDTSFLKTLSNADVRSGVGEMLKIHAIHSPETFDEIAKDYDDLFATPGTMLRYIRKSLDIKKAFIEKDEFDRGIRNILNYGHSFGHAIEAATKFAIPHGIAVTIGMDMAGYVGAAIGRSKPETYHRMKPTLRRNFAGYERTLVPLDGFLSAITKDKKNTDSKLTLILPGQGGLLERCEVPNDNAFQTACAAYLQSEMRK